MINKYDTKNPFWVGSIIYIAFLGIFATLTIVYGDLPNKYWS